MDYQSMDLLMVVLARTQQLYYQMVCDTTVD